ncbi:MAG: GTP-binding protein [Deferribacterales bacterium]
MLKFSAVYPPMFSGGAESFFYGFVRALIIRGCFNVDVKRALGIAGFYRSVTTPECWTVKLHGHQGIFGLMLSDVKEDESTAECVLDIKYFPDAEEEVLDTFSVMEILTTAEASYGAMVRDFASVSALRGMFSVGNILINIDKLSGEMSMTLVSETLSETRIRDGLYVQSNGQELVEPMGIDRHVSAYRLALPLFRCFTGCAAYSLEHSADGFFRSFADGKAVVAASDGSRSDIECPLNSVVEMTFTFGGQRTPLPEKTFPCTVTPFWWEKRQEKDHSKVMDSRPRLIIVSGFLGSGKTTYIRNLIEYETDKNRFVGVIQNEAGQSGLDGFLVDYDYSLVEIDEGCMCCSLSGQLKKAIAELSSERVPDTIILETSGVANPMNLIDEIDDVSEMARFDSVTTLVDLLTPVNMFYDNELMRQQIMSADIVVLTKADAVDDTAVRETAQAVAEINPDAMIVAAKGNMNYSMLYGTENESGLLANAGQKGHTHHHEHIGTKKISFHEPVSKDELIKMIENMPEDTFRVKGIVDIDGEGTIVVQSVNGRTELIAPDREPPAERFLVVIGKNLS